MGFFANPEGSKVGRWFGGWNLGSSDRTWANTDRSLFGSVGPGAGGQENAKELLQEVRLDS